MVTESKKICFAIMPFKDRFNDISLTIEEACKECEFQYVRGDHRNQPGSVMPQILSDIRTAAVIVADLTDDNPNVFYELGIAHQIKGPGHVVIINQSTDKSPYDVHKFRQLPYTHSQAGLPKLRKDLVSSLRKALETQDDNELWSIIRGPIERTRLIVRDLRRAISPEAPQDPRKLTVRMISGLGSLAISHRESPDPELGDDYKLSLLDERDALRDALVQGATLKSLLHPPRQFTPGMLPERLHVRYQRLIGLLEGRSDEVDETKAQLDIEAMKRSRFLMTPVPMPHVFIIGNQVAYEGIKRGGRRGYHMTHCETDPKAIKALIDDFDAHFGECQSLVNSSQTPEQYLADQLLSNLGNFRKMN